MSVFLADVSLSVLVVTIAVGIQDRPAAAPQQGPWSSDWKLVGEPTFTEAIASIGSIVFAYAGTPAFFSIVAEMRDPRQYTKALVVCQSTITVVYIVIGIVVYYFCGSYVASPALGSAGVTMKKVCYGLALPGLCIGTVLLCHARISSADASRIAKANTPPSFQRNTFSFVFFVVRNI